MAHQIQGKKTGGSYYSKYRNHSTSTASTIKLNESEHRQVQEKTIELATDGKAEKIEKLEAMKAQLATLQSSILQLENEIYGLDVAKKEQEKKEAEKKEAEKKEAEKKEAEKKEAEKKEQEKKEQERKEAEKKEQERKEAEKKEQEKKEQERKEAEKKEQERKEAEKKEQERKEMEARIRADLAKPKINTPSATGCGCGAQKAWFVNTYGKKR